MESRVNAFHSASGPFVSFIWPWFFAVSGLAYILSAGPFYLLFKFLGRYFRPLKLLSSQMLRFFIRLCLGPWAQKALKVKPFAGDGPRLYISNHRSHLDVFLLLAQIPGTKVVAGSYLFNLPVLGQLMRLSGQLEFTSGNFSSIKNAVTDGDNVLIFPELTRCQANAHKTQKFAQFPFQLAIETQAKIIPIVVRQTDQIWPRGSFLPKFRDSFETISLPVIDAGQFADAKQLLTVVQDKIDKGL